MCDNSYKWVTAIILLRITQLREQEQKAKKMQMAWPLAQLTNGLKLCPDSNDASVVSCHLEGYSSSVYLVPIATINIQQELAIGLMVVAVH